MSEHCHVGERLEQNTVYHCGNDQLLCFTLIGLTYVRCQ